MEISKRHHYIPRFLIEKFADSDNQVWVYYKERGEVLKKSSKSIFFEMERNSFEVNGEKIDNLEKMYRDIDNLLSKNLKEILSSQSMSGRELTMLLLLVTLTKWRVPGSDEIFNKEYRDMPIEQLGMKIRAIDSKEEVDNGDTRKIKEMDIVKEVKRLLLSVQPLVNDENLNDIHQNSFLVFDEEFPSLLGDTPIIEKPNPDHKNLADFIFPLSTSCTLICKRGAEKRGVSKIFYIQRDLTTFHLAKKYIVCKSKDHLLKISEMYSTLVKENKTHLLPKYVFEFIK